MRSINNISNLVKEVLTENEAARNSDNYLYYVVCKIVLKNQGININELSFKGGMLNKNKLNIPGFETVRRTRQKIQQHNSSLCGSEEVESQRRVKEKKFREYARKEFV